MSDEKTCPHISVGIIGTVGSESEPILLVRCKACNKSLHG